MSAEYADPDEWLRSQAARAAAADGPAIVLGVATLVVTFTLGACFEALWRRYTQRSRRFLRNLPIG